MFPSHDFNEIMPTIFRRFVEKEAHDWRQIYKVRHTHTHTHIYPKMSLPFIQQR